MQPGPKSIKMLTYNIHLRPPGVKTNVSDHKDARLSMFGDFCLKQYDIIAFQELYSSGTSRQSKMVQFGRRYGFDYFSASPSKGLLKSAIDGGLLSVFFSIVSIVLSKSPIVKSEKITFKKGVGADKYVAKGALYAKISITPQLSMHVFNTHLQQSEVNTECDDPSTMVR